MWWFHDGVMLSDGVDNVSIKLNMDDSVSSIVIGEVERTSGGNYTCKANNTVGTDQESYSVTILCKLNLSLVDPIQVISSLIILSGFYLLGGEGGQREASPPNIPASPPPTLSKVVCLYKAAATCAH